MSGSGARAGVSGLVGRIVEARDLWRWLFAIYAIVLFVATHWPRLVVEVPGVERPDLIIHFVAFGTWTGLFLLSGWVGRFGSAMHVAGSLLAGAVYASVDEGTQALPFVQRNCAWDDWFANLGGVAIGWTLGLIVIALSGRAGRSGALR